MRADAIGSKASFAFPRSSKEIGGNEGKGTAQLRKRRSRRASPLIGGQRLFPRGRAHALLVVGTGEKARVASKMVEKTAPASKSLRQHHLLLVRGEGGRKSRLKKKEVIWGKLVPINRKSQRFILNPAESPPILAALRAGNKLALRVSEGGRVLTP